MRILVFDPWDVNLAYLGCYGCEWVATPHLDRLAAEGVVFDRHFADVPGSFKGLYSFPWHKHDDPRDVEGTPPEAGGMDWSAALSDRGVVQYHLVAPRAMRASYAESQLEKMFRVLATNDRCLVRGDWLELRPSAVPDEFLRRYFSQQEREPDEEPLTPWLDPPTGPVEEADLERLQLTYAASVTYFDHQFGRLREELEERGLWDDLLVVVTSSYGLPLGEHGVVGTANARLHEEVVHLPLIVRLPRAARAGARVAALTQTVDLPATFFDVFGLPCTKLHGQSLLPLIRGEAEQLRAYACSAERVGEEIMWSLRTSDWAFLLPVAWPESTTTPRPQLYVKPDDRWEVNDVAQHHPELTEHLEQVLRGFAEAARQPGPLRPPELRDVERAPARADGPVPEQT